MVLVHKHMRTRCARCDGGARVGLSVQVTLGTNALTWSLRVVYADQLSAAAPWRVLLHVLQFFSTLRLAYYPYNHEHRLGGGGSLGGVYRFSTHYSHDVC